MYLDRGNAPRRNRLVLQSVQVELFRQVAFHALVMVKLFNAHVKILPTVAFGLVLGGRIGSNRLEWQSPLLQILLGQSLLQSMLLLQLCLVLLRMLFFVTLRRRDTRERFDLFTFVSRPRRPRFSSRPLTGCSLLILTGFIR